MNSLHLQITCIALLTSIACCLPGIFLILRGVALMSDAISHAILPGIIIMFLLIHNLESPLLILGAASAGMATVALTEYLIQAYGLKKDAALGLVFPLFFSVGVLLINLYTHNVHLDIDMVLVGELAFAPFNRLMVGGYDCGPYALWSMALITLLNGCFIKLFYKELQLTTFDPLFAYTVGFSAPAFYYGLMLMTSITTVAAFNTMGSLVVVALMLTPPAIGYLLSTRLLNMIIYTLGAAIIATLSGYALACIADVSIAGSIACMNGFLFLLTFLFAPQKGLFPFFGTTPTK